MNTSHTLLDQFRDIAAQTRQPLDALVPVDHYALYYLIASEIARATADNAESDFAIFVDAQTAAQVDMVDGARVAARNVFISGTPPESWGEGTAFTVLETPQSGCDLFLVVLSRTMSLAIVCEQEEGLFQGAWTAHRDHVTRLASLLLGQSATQALDMPESVSSGDNTVLVAMRLMAILARQLDMRQRNIASEKDDITGVLEILKAISAKRRAHDILYVFVEQIATAVQMDRCSVVRVWGDEQRGHVLASHEDESVRDLAIDLGKYPELLRALETRQKVIINDTSRDPLMRPFGEELRAAGVRSLIVIPVVLFDQNVGSFLLRAARKHSPFTLRDISFCEIVAKAAANALERAQLFEDIQKANERLERLAVTDGLTGVYNHRYFRDRLEDELARARRYNLPLSCMILDVDNFKRVNDTYGHLQGDTVLRGIAECTLSAVRKSDVVARYGGEEFVVLMPQTGLEGAQAQGERIRKQIEGWPFEGFPEKHEITVSVGVAVFHPENIADSEALIRVADTALYRAKAAGKNRVVIGN